MSELINPIEWKKPESDMPYHGNYFVAVKYPAGLGTYDLAEWNGEKWLLDYEAEVIGWVAMTEFMNSIKAGWPSWDDVDLRRDKQNK